MIVSSVWVSSSVVILLHLVHISSLILLHDLNQLLEDLGHVRVRDQVVEVETSILLCLIPFERLFVDGFFSLQSPDLLDLVVVDNKLLTFKGLIVKILFGLGGGVWGHKADEGIDSGSCFRFAYFDLFDLSMGLK